MTDQKIALQIELERKAVGLGVERYRKDQPMPWRTETAKVKEECALPPGKELLRRTLEPMTEAIDAFIEEASSGKAGRKHTAVKYMVHFPAEVMAYVTGRRLLNGAVKAEQLTSTAVSIATLLEDHYRFTEFATTNPGLFRMVDRKLKTSHGGHRRHALYRYLKMTSVVGIEWSEADKLKVGIKLIELFIEATGLVTERMVKTGRKTKYVIEATPKTREWLDKMHSRCELLAPVYLPMIVKPDDWTNPLNGGYLDKRMSRVDLVKVRNRNTVDELFSVDMPIVYDAVNAVQAVPWRINTGVLDVFRVVWASGDSLGGLPPREDKALPARPSDIPSDVSMKDLPEEQQLRLKKWKADTAEGHSYNARLVSKRLAAAQKLWVAEEFKDEEEIYFPHNLDFRGRMYAVPTLVNPQADDLGRSVIHFAEGKPLGESGAWWLAIHIANLFGVDKVSFEDRVKWTEDNTEALMDSALRPLDGARLWDTADKPWCALAACFEWLGYQMQGDDYVSHIPIAMDGSCSGLQHYSAMLKDPVGAEAVNLTPSETPNDIYARVAERVSLALDRSTDGEAIVWKDKVTRKITKQPCMTYAYSATTFGMKEQIVQALKGLDESGNHLDGAPYHTSAAFIAPLVREKIREVVVAAAVAMDWLQSAARVASKAGLPIRWSAPNGLPVVQDRKKSTSKKQHVWFNGKRIQFRLAHDTMDVDARRQATSIAPNFIHSMDSAHLMRTVVSCDKAGVSGWAMVHDSFGTHACDVDLMNEVLRDEFVEMYSENRLELFRDQIASQLEPEMAAELAPVPPMGSFDLGQVRQSLYFFS